MTKTTTEATAEATQAAEDDPAVRFLDRLIAQIGGQARVQAVFGDPVERDGITVIPVARVRWGIGGGGGGGSEGSGSGGGGGVTAVPVGYVEIGPSGAEFRPLPRAIGPGQLLGGAVAVAIVLRAIARFRR